MVCSSFLLCVIHSSLCRNSWDHCDNILVLFSLSQTASTNTRVLFINIISISCLCSMAIWQVFYLRRFFRSKKLIEWRRFCERDLSDTAWSSSGLRCFGNIYLSVSKCAVFLMMHHIWSIFIFILVFPLTKCNGIHLWHVSSCECTAVSVGQRASGEFDRGILMSYLESWNKHLK